MGSSCGIMETRQTRQLARQQKKVGFSLSSIPLLFFVHSCHPRSFRRSPLLPPHLYSAQQDCRRAVVVFISRTYPGNLRPKNRTFCLHPDLRGFGVFLPFDDLIISSFRQIVKSFFKKYFHFFEKLVYYYLTTYPREFPLGAVTLGSPS